MKLNTFAGSAAALIVIAGALSAVPAMAQQACNDNVAPPPLAQTDFYGGPGASNVDYVQYGAQGRNGTAISWRGSVDDTVDVYIQGGSINSHVDSGGGVQNERSRVFNALPNRHVQAFLTNVEGRGRVWIFQQPTRENGFTVGVRIRDPQAGRANYHFGLAWQFAGGPGFNR